MVLFNLLKAGAKTLMGEGSFGDNLFHPNKLQLKIEKLPVNKDIESDVYGVFVKGSPEVDLSLPIVLIFKLFDKLTSSPIVSTFDTFMEENSRVFEHKCELGDMSGKYYPDWTRVSAVIPDTLIGPYKGTRELELECYCWFEQTVPSFYQGQLPENSKGFISITKHDFTLYLSNSGYSEVDDDRLIVQIASVKLAISIAFADQSLDTSDGNVIKKWIKEIIESSPKSLQEEIKTALNGSLDQGFQQAKKGNIDLKLICSEIDGIGSKADKYDLLELCLDVMAADGKADQEELKQITEISNLIGIDYDEMTSLKDQRIIKLNPASSSTSAGLEEQLGIDPTWTNKKINEHILKEYGKWNGRLNSLAEGIERDNAQNMLDLIAEARKKYS